MEYNSYYKELNDFFDLISVENATEGSFLVSLRDSSVSFWSKSFLGQKFAVRSAMGRMVRQLSREQRVLKFLYVSISKLSWEEFYSAAKR